MKNAKLIHRKKIPACAGMTEEKEIAGQVPNDKNYKEDSSILRMFGMTVSFEILRPFDYAQGTASVFDLRSE